MQLQDVMAVDEGDHCWSKEVGEWEDLHVKANTTTTDKRFFLCTSTATMLLFYPVSVQSVCMVKCFRDCLIWLYHLSLHLCIYRFLVEMDSTPLKPAGL